MKVDECSHHISSFVIKTPIGLILTTSCPDGLHAVQMKEALSPPPEDLITTGPDCVKVIETDGDANDHLKSCIQWFEDYFAPGICGRQAKIPSLCFLNISPFQQKVYQELSGVRMGQKISYKELSIRSLAHDKGSRAVGNAMKRNPYLLVIPCHRVMRSNGHVGQYSAAGGSGLKQLLLSFEEEQVSTHDELVISKKLVKADE